MKILIRLAAEMAIKSDRIRAKFLNRLMRNIQEALSSQNIKHKIENHWSRLFIEVDSSKIALTSEILSRIFGISSCSPVEIECTGGLQEIVTIGTKHYSEVVKGKKFAVRTKRSGEHPFNSLELNAALGQKLCEAGGTVDLDHPEVKVSLEVRPQATFFFSREIRGSGGFPIGVGGHALCLASGGFDSAVAAWLIQKRGVVVDHVFFNLADSAYERSVLSVLKFLCEQWSYGTSPRLHIVDFKPVVQEIVSKVKPGHLQVILKRLFYRAGEVIAHDIGADALITGEAIGQVSSQTLKNLRAIEDALTKLPVLRPLIGADKDEIFVMARKIGTFELSAVIREVCSLTSTYHPVTECSPESARKEERKCDLTILDNAINQRKIVMIKDLSLHDLVSDDLSIVNIPDKAEVIDCRSSEEFKRKHYPGSRHILFRDLLLDSKLVLPREKTYVLYCQVGLKSAVAAQKLRQNGYAAFSIRGGAPSILDAN